MLRREIELARDGHSRFALMLLDLNHFKSINNAHGHDVGDRVLQRVAAILVQCVRGSDYLFRLGGEEFLLVLVAVNPQHARVLAEQIRLSLAESPLTLPAGRTLSVTASIGVAPLNGHPDYEHLVNRADRAICLAKQRCRDQVVMADDSPAAAATSSSE